MGQIVDQPITFVPREKVEQTKNYPSIQTIRRKMNILRNSPLVVWTYGTAGYIGQNGESTGPAFARFRDDLDQICMPSTSRDNTGLFPYRMCGKGVARIPRGDGNGEPFGFVRLFL